MARGLLIRQMMTPSEIRAELLQQHARIRVMANVAETIARRVRAGGKEAFDLVDCVARLGDAIREHAAREEELLGGLIPVLDPFGEARVAVMDEAHREAHTQIETALHGIPSIPNEIAAVGVIALVRLLCAHMDREEAAFLNEHVLRDDRFAVKPPSPPPAS